MGEVQNQEKERHLRKKFFSNIGERAEEIANIISTACLRRILGRLSPGKELRSPSRSAHRWGSLQRGKRRIWSFSFYYKYLILPLDYIYSGCEWLNRRKIAFVSLSNTRKNVEWQLCNIFTSKQNFHLVPWKSFGTATMMLGAPQSGIAWVCFRFRWILD